MQWQVGQLECKLCLMAQPPVWSFIKAAAKCWEPDIPVLQSAPCPHIDSKIQSTSFPVTQLLSEALLCAKAALLDGHSKSIHPLDLMVDPIPDTCLHHGSYYRKHLLTL